MVRYRSNKQAFIIAALVVLLCLVCLAGATLALFTSDINDGTIGIIATSGNIKVDIVDAYTGSSLVGEALEFYTSFERKEILFEPGATFYTQGFKVKNVGNIPVNFRLSVSKDENIDMDAFNEAFEVWIATDYNDPNQREKLEKFEGHLKVDAISDEVYYLFIKMKETAGNEFQKQEYSGIGVTVYAVQGNVNITEIKE